MQPGTIFSSASLHSMNVKNGDTSAVGGAFTGTATIDQISFTRPERTGVFFLLGANGQILQTLVIGTNNSNISDIAFGKQNDLFIAGDFKDSVRIGNQVIVQTDVANHFLARLDRNLNCLWLKYFHSSTSVFSLLEVKTDSIGNPVLTGSYEATAYFGDTTFTPAPGERNTCVLKYNPQGNLLWAHKSSAIRTFPFGIRQSEIFVAGAYSVSGLHIDTIHRAYIPGYYNHYILRLSKDGKAIRAYTFLSDSTDGNGGAFIQSLAFGRSDSSFVFSGYYTKGTFRIGNYALPVSPNAFYGFIVELKLDGTLLWARQLGNPNSQINNVYVNTDTVGNIYATNVFYAQQLKIGCQTYNTPEFMTPPYWIKLGHCSLHLDSARVTHPSCFGSQNGSITTHASSREGPVTYNWGGGNTGPVRSNIGAGTYRLILSDGSCCRDTSYYTLTQPPALPQPLFFGNDTSMVQDTVGYKAIAPGSGYTLEWQVTNGQILNGQNTDSITVLWNEAGPGSVRLLFSNGDNCLKDTVLQVAVLTSASGWFQNQAIRVWPNPCQRFVTVQGLENSNYVYQLYSSTGKIIRENKPEEGRIDLDRLPPGMYLLRTHHISGKPVSLRFQKE